MDRAVGIDVKDVAAVVVTRGDVDLTEIVDSLVPFFGSVCVWDNATLEDLSVYGRYAALNNLLSPVAYVQDDDCVLEPNSIRALLDNYTPGWIVANMPARFRPHYPDSCLVGFGAIFARDLPERAFARFRDGLVDYTTAQFERECDTVFTTLTQRRLLDLPYRDLLHAHWPDRLWKQKDHGEQRARMLELARQVRDAS